MSPKKKKKREQRYAKYKKFSNDVQKSPSFL